MAVTPAVMQEPYSSPSAATLAALTSLYEVR